MHELLPILEEKFEVVRFSDEPGCYPIHNLNEIDLKEPFDYSLTFNEDRKSGIYFRFATLALPGVLVLADANFDRLYFSLHWQFTDLSKKPILTQMIENASSIAVLNDHALSNVRNLKLDESKSLFGIQVPVRQRSSAEERMINQDSLKTDFCLAYSARYLNEEKSHEVIETLLELKRSGVPAKLLWLTRKTEIESIRSFLDIEAQRHMTDIQEQVELVVVENFVAERETLCRADVFLSLRKDFLHSPPTAFYHALALGVPTVASEIGPMMAVPKSSLLFVPAGAGEEQGIFTAIRSIYENMELRRELSEQSRKYASLVHDPKIVASDLLQILEYDRKENPDIFEKTRRRHKELEAAIC